MPLNHIKNLEASLPEKDLIGTPVGNLVVKVAHEYGLSPENKGTLDSMCKQLLDFLDATDTIKRGLGIDQVAINRMKILILACGSENNEVARYSNRYHQFSDIIPGFEVDPNETRKLREKFTSIGELRTHLKSSNLGELDQLKLIATYMTDDSLRESSMNMHRGYAPWMCRLLAELDAYVKGLDIEHPGEYPEKWNYEKCDLTEEGSVSRIIPSNTADVVICKDFIYGPRESLAMAELKFTDRQKYFRTIRNVANESRKALCDLGVLIFDHTFYQKQEGQLHLVDQSKLMPDEITDIRRFS